MLWSAQVLSSGPLRDAWLAFARPGAGLSKKQVEASDVEGAHAACRVRVTQRVHTRMRARPEDALGAAVPLRRVKLGWAHH